MERIVNIPPKIALNSIDAIEHGAASLLERSDLSRTPAFPIDDHQPLCMGEAGNAEEREQSCQRYPRYFLHLHGLPCQYVQYALPICIESGKEITHFPKKKT